MALLTAAYKAKNELNLPIVGLDIAGAEAGYPASDHLEAFAFAHKFFMHTTVHTWEGYGSESVYQAVTDLHAEKIGYGYHVLHYEEVKVKDMSSEDRLTYVTNLSQYLGNSRVCMELCVSSNLQTIPGIENDATRHPFLRMLEKNWPSRSVRTTAQYHTQICSRR